MGFCSGEARRTNSWDFHILLGMLFLLVAQPCWGMQADPEKPLSVSALQVDANRDGIKDYLGEKITVAGRTNVADNMLSKNNNMVYIQDDSAGLLVYFPDSLKQEPTIQKGDSLIVSGEFKLYKGKPEVSVSSFRIVDAPTRVPDPIPLPYAFNNPDKYDGMLVQGEAIIIGKNIDPDYKRLTLAPNTDTEQSIYLYIPDYHPQSENFNFEILSLGDDITVEGIMQKHQFQNSGEIIYQVLPRTTQDISYSSIPKRYLYVILALAILILVGVTAWIFTLRKKVKSRTSELSAALEEKDILMDEIHHRVKNNLSIISGLIGLQLDTVDDKKTQEVLEDSQSRIQSMAMIHEKLYQTETISSIKLDDYIKGLVETICDTFDKKSASVDLQLDLEPIETGINTTVACGLLVNELVVNAFKHAFKANNNGILKIQLRKKNGEAELIVADNGPGLPEDFMSASDESLGSMLINTFASQLESEMEILEDREGAAFRFRFPLD